MSFRLILQGQTRGEWTQYERTFAALDDAVAVVEELLDGNDPVGEGWVLMTLIYHGNRRGGVVSDSGTFVRRGSTETAKGAASLGPVRRPRKPTSRDASHAD